MFCISQIFTNFVVEKVNLLGQTGSIGAIITHKARIFNKLLNSK